MKGFSAFFFENKGVRLGTLLIYVYPIILVGPPTLAKEAVVTVR